MFIERRLDFELIRERYEEDFPLLERKSFQKMRDMLATDKYLLYICCGEDLNDFKGYVTVYAQGKTAWVDYFAVAKESRGAGVGTFVIGELSKIYDTLFFEVEKDDLIENSQKNKRQRFYKRAGAELLTPSYLLPTADGGMEMDLLVLTKVGVEADAFKQFIKKAVSFIHSDFAHTGEVLASYLDDIV